MSRPTSGVTNSSGPPQRVESTGRPHMSDSAADTEKVSCVLLTTVKAESAEEAPDLAGGRRGR